MWSMRIRRMLMRRLWSLVRYWLNRDLGGVQIVTIRSFCMLLLRLIEIQGIIMEELV
jgi:hypothetical protein